MPAFTPHKIATQFYGNPDSLPHKNSSYFCGDPDLIPPKFATLIIMGTPMSLGHCGRPCMRTLGQGDASTLYPKKSLRNFLGTPCRSA